MDLTETGELLAQSDTDPPVVLTRSVLSKLTIDDLPNDAAFQIGTTKDRVIDLEWDGSVRREGKQFVADAEYLNTRK
jgi:hypothetical protein